MTNPLRTASRLEWVEGSALKQRDLASGVAAEDALLAAHVRAVHDTWGVALGLTTILAADRRSVLVTPGYAITCMGMAILLPDAQVVAVPATTLDTDSAWDLILQAPASAASDACTRPTTCDLAVPPSRATVGFHPTPAHVPGVRPPTAIDQRTSLVLASFVTLKTGELRGPTYDGRRGARVLERPHVASGVIAAGGVQWQQSHDHLIATIDTASAGFSQAPVYKVWIAAHAPWPTGVVGGLLSVALARTSSVRVQLLVPGRSAATARSVAAGVSLGWLGVEPKRGGPPMFSSSQIVAPAAALIDRAQWAAALASFPGFRP